MNCRNAVWYRYIHCTSYCQADRRPDRDDHDRVGRQQRRFGQCRRRGGRRRRRKGPAPRQVFRRGVADLRGRDTAVVRPVYSFRVAAACRGRRSAVHEHVRCEATLWRPGRYRARRRGGGPQCCQEGRQRVRKHRQGTNVILYYPSYDNTLYSLHLNGIRYNHTIFWHYYYLLDMHTNTLDQQLVGYHYQYTWWFRWVQCTGTSRWVYGGIRTRACYV